MQRVFLFFHLLIASLALKGQHKDNSFAGWIIADGKKINFSIQYTIARNNLISGTSITAAGTNQETTCKIKGKYNPKNKSIFFYETVVISSKAKFEHLNFCLLSARLKKKVTASELIYSGSFVGSVRGTKNKCAQGSMYISTKRTIDQPKKNKPKPVVVVPEKKITVDTLNSSNKSEKLIKYALQGQTIYLDLWDDLAADGDRIELYLDGKKILSNYELIKTKKRISLKLDPKQDVHTIKIVALNEGKASPNTSRISLSATSFQKELTAYIKKNEAIYILLSND